MNTALVTRVAVVAAVVIFVCAPDVLGFEDENCCFPTGGCTPIADEEGLDDCIDDGGTVITGPCDTDCIAAGACCGDFGTGIGCMELTPDDCGGSGGTYFGDGTSCVSQTDEGGAIVVTCPGACCAEDDCLVTSSQIDCEKGEGGVFYPDTPCEDVECNPMGACCVGAVKGGGCISPVTMINCIKTWLGEFLGEGTTCDSPAACSPGADRITATEKGSVLYFSAVNLRWGGAAPAPLASVGPAELSQDTFISITNDWVEDTGVQMYFVNGDPPLPADPVTGERAHPGWNWVDVKIDLTANQPAYWSLMTGQPGPGGSAVSPFTILDPAGPGQLPGRPAPDGSGDRVLRGYIVAFACDPDGCQVSWNHLSGSATTVDYAHGLAWETNAWASQDVNLLAPGTPVGPCGTINFDGVDFTPPPGILMLDFYAVGSQAFSGGAPFQLISVDTRLALHPVDADLRQENHGPYTTKATVTIWNENETQFTGLHKCITCWDQTLLSQYSAVANHFLLGNLQTDKGKARIDGLASTICSSNCCIARTGAGDHPGCASLDCQELVCQVNSFCCTMEWNDECVWIAVDLCTECDGINTATPLLGVQTKLLGFLGDPRAAAGFNLIGMGTETTSIRYDPVTGGGGPPPSIDGGDADGTGSPRDRARREVRKLRSGR